MAKTKAAAAVADPEEAPTVEDLQAAADEKAEEARVAQEEAVRLADASKEIHKDAQGKVDEALKAADDAAQNVIRAKAEVAKAEAAASAARLAEAQATLDAAQAVAAEAQADADRKAATAQALDAARRPSLTSFRIEGGGWGALAPGYSSKDFRVRDTDGNTYDHCSEEVNTGEWIYRRQ